VKVRSRSSPWQRYETATRSDEDSWLRVRAGQLLFES